jgi:hypothetical protein
VSGWERLSATSINNNTSPKTITRDCSAGKKLLGGGASVAGATLNLAIASSGPVDDDTWSVTVNEANSENGSWSVTAWVICGVVT